MGQFNADAATPCGAEPPADLVQTITRAVADAEGVEVTALSPLYDVVDPCALTALAETSGQGGDPRSLVVTFGYHGYAVTVTGDGTVELGE